MKRKPKRRPDGRWQRRMKGRLFISSISQEDADRQAKEYAEAIKAGLNERYIDMPVQKYFLRWLPVHLVNVSENWYSLNAHICDMFCTDYGECKLKDIKPSDIKAFYTNHFANLSDSYIQDAKKLLIRVFDSAMEDGYCRINPARSTTAKPHKGTEGTHRAITDEERRIIETVATDHPMYPVAMAMLYAGLRPSEALALNVTTDVDFDEKVIHLRNFRHVSGRKGYITGEGKTPNAVRDIPLFSPLAAVLKNRVGLLITYDSGKVLSKTSWEENWGSYISAIEQELNGGHRKRWHHRTYADAVKRPDLHRAIRDLERTGMHKEAEALRLADWRTFTVKAYDLRHSFCTYCCKNHIDAHVLMQWMGHSSMKMIQQIYDHLDNERIQFEATKLENAIISSQNGSL